MTEKVVNPLKYNRGILLAPWNILILLVLFGLAHYFINHGKETAGLLMVVGLLLRISITLFSKEYVFSLKLIRYGLLEPLGIALVIELFSKIF